MQPQDLLEQDESEEDEEVVQSTKRRRTSIPELHWRKQVDIQPPPLHDYKHQAPESIKNPSQYFHDLFTFDLVDEIVFQINLYARQKSVNTSFSIDRIEFMKFIGITIYMGVCILPNIEDYWNMDTRVPQVANVMSSKRFRTIRSFLHFNNNDVARGSIDRFYKIRPVISSITKQFLKVPATPTQSVDEVMVAYKGTFAGNLRQYIRTKPDKWGFKLFCRSSVDGFIHDILMYQGEPTFQAHHTALSEQESAMLVSSKIVIVLLKTIKHLH